MEIKEKKKLSSEQIVVGATGFASLFSLIGIMFYGIPFFYDFWVQEYGWSRVTVTSGTAFGRIAAAFLGYIVGWLIDKFGPRKLILLGILLGGGAFIALSRMSSLWEFYTFSLIAAMGYICGGPLPNQVLTSRWFNKARGKAMSIAYLGVGIGGVLVPQIARHFNATIGWHQSLMILGILMIVIAFPIAWMSKDKPPDYLGSIKQGKEKTPLKVILKSRYFYLLLIGSVCSIAAVSGTVQNLKLFFTIDLQYTQAQSANILSLLLFSSIFGRLFMGWLADKISKKYVMITIYFLAAISISLLYLHSTIGMIYVFAILFGIALGGDYMIIPLMAAEIFGIRIMGQVMGLIITTDILADALSPMMVGWLRDSTGSYFSGFSVLIALAIIGTVTVLFLPKKSSDNTTYP